MTVEEFEESWNHTITSHHLQENEWLVDLYEEWKRWVPAFSKVIPLQECPQPSIPNQ